MIFSISVQNIRLTCNKSLQYRYNSYNINITCVNSNINHVNICIIHIHVYTCISVDTKCTSYIAHTKVSEQKWYLLHVKFTSDLINSKKPIPNSLCWMYCTNLMFFVSDESSKKFLNNLNTGEKSSNLNSLIVYACLLRWWSFVETETLDVIKGLWLKWGKGFLWNSLLNTATVNIT